VGSFLFAHLLLDILTLAEGGGGVVRWHFVLTIERRKIKRIVRVFKR
jgi:hypothetical protein